MKWKQYLGHPTLIVVFGRRGSGKSYLLSKIAESWDSEEKIAMIDPYAAANKESRPVDYLWAEAPSKQVIRDKGVKLLLVDEAHLFLPNKLDSGKTALGEIVTGGRHLDCTIVLATQRPASLWYSCWSLADKAFMFNMTGGRDLKRLEEFGLEKRVDVLKTLPVGTCIAWTAKDFQRPTTTIRIR